ncbi:MAG: MOSC domain-containing protein [Devosia sp.]|uniref:MOSC domain-containing protein n=1 Tax=Devosia sp. TaxID=1871048 RepID=UPI0024C6D875|nr:MOSC domain-containing protein [Devosia sp.]UYN98493.1 MAG: MOSC domain-containing protein [Devosia sp.]
MARLVSVNVGVPTNIPGTGTLTGIYKQPVSGPVKIETGGLAHDVIADRHHHGGADQAVYIYFLADYAYWAGEGIEPEPGLFGENLTIDGPDSKTCCVGDRLAMGEVILEVTYHRTPCMTFAAKMGDPRWLKRFHKARRSGAYCRVIRPGTVEAGMDISITPYAGERISVAELMGFDGVADIPRDFMTRALTTPIRAKTRFKYENRLAALF